MSNRRIWRPLLCLFAFLAASYWLISRRPGWAPWIGLVDGLAVGTVLGATGLVRSYDDSWDEFWQTTTLAYLLGVFAVFYYWLRRESPSAFFWVECVAAFMGYFMLFYVPPLVWLTTDWLLFLGTFVGWFFSGFFRPEYY